MLQLIWGYSIARYQGFILSEVICEQEAALTPWKKFGEVLQLQLLSLQAHRTLIYQQCSNLCWHPCGLHCSIFWVIVWRLTGHTGSHLDRHGLHSNLKSHPQTLGCVKGLWCQDEHKFLFCYLAIELYYIDCWTIAMLMDQLRLEWFKKRNHGGLTDLHCSSGWWCLWQSISCIDFPKHQIRDQLSCSSSTPKTKEPVENSKFWNSQWNWVQPCSSNTSGSSTYLCYC